jgi:hypothetical protein
VLTGLTLRRMLAAPGAPTSAARPVAAVGA